MSNVLHLGNIDSDPMNATWLADLYAIARDEAGQLDKPAAVAIKRQITAELDACARHLLKGLAPSEWRCEKISALDVNRLNQDLQAGVARNQAVQGAVQRRRYVTIDGQVIEPQPTQADQEAAQLLDIAGNDGVEYFSGQAAGSGGAYPLPHDANDIYHDLHDLKPVRKNASDLTDPNPVEAEHVANLMRQSFPEKALKWVPKATWIGPVKVPTDRFDVDSEASWAASHQDEKVKRFKKAIKNKDAHLHPVIGVQVPGDDRVKIVDGHHRFLAYRALDKKVPVYVGTISDGSDDWAETHSSQLSDVNKTVDTPSKERDTARLRHYWAHGEGAIKVRWGEPGDFDRCVRHVGKFMDNPQGYCAERHHDALGIWPATHAKEIRDAEKLATPGIVKVGPHGFIHGWIYVGPKDDIGSDIEHPEHGHGVIHAADKGSIDVKHDSGEVKHYAATFAPQKAKFVKTGSLEGKTHIANVKPLKDGTIVNKDDGKTVGSVFQNGDGTWAYHHEGSNTMDAKTGYASKHKAIQGLIEKHNEHADAHVVAPQAVTHAPKLPDSVTLHHGNDMDATATVKEHGKIIGSVGQSDDDTWNYTHGPTGNDSLESYDTQENAVTALHAYHHELADASTSGTHSPSVDVQDYGNLSTITSGDTAIGYAVHAENGTWGYVHATDGVEDKGFPSKNDAVDALLAHHESLSIIPSMDHSLSQGDAAHEALTHGESHVEPVPASLLGSTSIPSHVEASDLQSEINDDYDNNDASSMNQLIYHAPTGQVVGQTHYDASTDTVTAGKLSDGQEFSMHAGDDKTALATFAKHHNATYGAPTEEKPDYAKTGSLSPTSVTVSPNVGNTASVSTFNGTKIGQLNAGAWADSYSGFTHEDGHTESFPWDKGAPQAKTELLAYHNSKYDGTEAVAKIPDHLDPKDLQSEINDKYDASDPSSSYNQLIVHKPTGQTVGYTQYDTGSDGVTGGKLINGQKFTTPSSEEKESLEAFAKFHNSVHGTHLFNASVEENPAAEETSYKKLGIISDTDVEAISTNDTDDAFDFTHEPSGVTIGHFDTDTGKLTHADGTDMGYGGYDIPEENDMANALIMHHNATYGNTPAYAKVGSLQPIETTNHLNADNTGFDIKDNKGVKVGTINFDKDKGQGYSSVTHADGTIVPVEVHTSAQAKQSLLNYHNSKYGDATLPKPAIVTPSGEAKVTPESVAANVANLKPTPWVNVGSKIGTKDVATKKDTGDVIVKGTTTKIGTVVNTGHGFQATHEDDWTGKYNKKSEALAGLTTHHNQSVAIKNTVKPDADSDLAKSTKLSTYYHQTKHDYVTGNVTDKNGDPIGNVKDNGDGTFTVIHKSGATWQASTDSHYSATQSLVTGHNQAIDVAHGKSTHEAPVVTPHVPASSGAVAPAISDGTVKVSFTHSKMIDDQPLSSAEYKGIKKYTGSWYSTINKKLAVDKAGADEDLKKYGTDAAAIHTGLQRSELTHDMTLHRGVGDANAMLGPLGSSVGNVQVQHSFMSTSTGSGFGGGLKLVVHAPKGAKGMNVKTFSNYPSEAEILFQHGTAYRVDSDEMIGNQRTAHITLVGQYNKDGSITPYAEMGSS